MFPDSPFGGVKIVGAIAQVVDKSEWKTGVCYDSVSPWGVNLYGLVPKVGEGILQTKLRLGISIAPKQAAHGHRVMGN